MKIGILVHSQTGNTYSVAEELEQKLLVDGHLPVLIRINTLDDKKTDARKIELNDIPDISTYDAIVFGAPVHAFSLSPVMKAFLTQTSLVKGKKAACFVTQSFPYPWMGGNRAIKQMRNICKSKGYEVCGTGIINWSNKQRKNLIIKMLQRFSSQFKY